MQGVQRCTSYQCSVVFVCACLSVGHNCETYKSAELAVMLFWVRNWVGPTNNVFGGGPGSPREAAILWVRPGPLFGMGQSYSQGGSNTAACRCQYHSNLLLYSHWHVKSTAGFTHWGLPSTKEVLTKRAQVELKRTKNTIISLQQPIDKKAWKLFKIIGNSVISPTIYHFVLVAVIDW